MKNILLITGLLISLAFTSCTQSPNAKDILKKSFDKCESVENGYYEMTHRNKYMSGNDTLTNNYKCYFQKLTSDTIYSFAFHNQKYRDGKYSRDVLYTANDFVNYSEKDSSGEIMSTTLWAKKIISYKNNYTFYPLITNKENLPFPNDSVDDGNKYIFEFIGEDSIGGKNCDHIKMNIISEDDSTEMMKPLRIEFHYWINKQDNIPTKFTFAIDMLMDNDTMYQFEQYELTKYEFNKLKDDSQLKLSSIPSYINIKTYQPYKSPELLPKDTIAPNWSLISLKDETINLSDYKGQLVLIDFFYKSCYPCMLALPALQNLHEKYNKKGLKVIGINPYDTKEDDDIENFLAKRGVTYTILLGGKNVAKEYHVSGYPAIYLIDKEGKIILVQDGYGEGVEEHIEKIIIDNL